MLDPYTKLLNLAKALILLNLRVACVDLVYDVFECKNSLTFNGESLADFAKLRTEPYAANPCKVSATFVSQILKGIQAPLSLPLV